jgi:glycerol uptake facilitator-like aquaporin
MAGTADDGPLGSPRPSSRQGNGRRNSEGVPRRILHARPPYQSLPLSSPRDNRRVCTQDETRRHRTPMKFTLGARLTAEFIGTAFLVAAVVGSGVMGEKLAGGNVAIALLANTIATGAALIALISTFGSVSGAHFNPVVSLADAISGDLSWPDARAYVAVQVVGGIAGAAFAHLMFGLPVVSLARHARGGPALALSEFIATFGLLSVIWGCSRFRPAMVPVAVGSYITAAYWFTASTSFANPAVTIARSLSNTFAGIRPVDVPLFLCAQIAGGLAATWVFRRLRRVAEIQREL